MLTVRTPNGWGPKWLKVTAFCLAAAAPALGEEIQLAAAVHIHSRYSNGNYSPNELARFAEEKGIDVLILTDSYLTTVTYGIWPFDRVALRGVNRVVRPGVRDHGIQAYLNEIRDVSKNHPNLILIAGVEAAPHYSWSGRPWDELTLSEFDRHLTVLGLDAEGLLGLPVIENESWTNTRLDPLLLGIPLILILAGLLSIARQRERRIRLRIYRLKITYRPRGWALALVLFGGVLAWFNFPYGRISNPYGAAPDSAPYQKLIDYVDQRRGVVYWSYPEAGYGDVFQSGARMVSRPHPEDLLRTDGYHGFEGLYGDKITAVLPGRQWDSALRAFLRKRRRSAPFVMTGINFHDFREAGSRWYDLDAGQTILLVDEKSEEAVLQSLKNGRLYATFQAPPQKLRLRQFEVACGGDGPVGQGQHCETPSPVTIEIRLEWLGEPWPENRPFRVELIHNGHLAHSRESRLPLRWRLNETLPPGEHYFRLHASSDRDYRVLSNPIFVTVR